MPYYQFTISLKAGEPLQFIRQLDVKDLDQVWRIYEKKAKDHWKRQMTSFRVIQMSKLDYQVKDWIKLKGKTTANFMDDLLNTPDVKLKAYNRKKGRDEGPSLEERK